ncbi:MAG: heparinase II/III family protein, partial [Marinirhabdus sp.]
MNIIKQQTRYLYLCLYLLSLAMYAQAIPSDRVLPVGELHHYLKDSVKQELGTASTSTLANHFRASFAERYFYDWRKTGARFETYRKLYPKMEGHHTHRALDHLHKFEARTPWKLPFHYKNGAPVNAYALRHLARQHKMVDIAFYYRYKNKDRKYVDYFTQQLQSLNHALAHNTYETIKDGNGVYEAFRSGYRILNWLHVHSAFLGENAYSNAQQLTTIATLLQHASHLYRTNTAFKAGNHQTRGLSALAMVAILFNDFKDADLWYDRAMRLLEEHLKREINADGFQFERTVHYHQSDIDNYFYVYQLAKKNTMSVSRIWEEKLRALFTTLAKVAYPDGSAPVFSDDTDSPWAEKNDISGTLTLGYLLFNDPGMGYFSNTTVQPKYVWYLSQQQLDGLGKIKREQPKTGSYAFKQTGYYIMREGWGKRDNMLVVSSGLDANKPDHQHGDMLGIQAMANGNVILPNYQVRYSLGDLELFKNSMVKNVALVDA